jgi:two-component system sensor histidine kinase DegS
MEVEQYVLDTGKGLRKEVGFQKNERQVIYNMAIEPLFDEMKGVVGLTIAVMDITEQRRLETEKHEYAAQMEMQRRLIGQSEMERSELSRNLHDGPIQSLVNLGFSLQIIKEILQEERVGKAEGDLQRMGEEIKGAISELRSVCNDLRPPEFSRLGVRRAIQENIKEFQQKHPTIRITTDLSDDPNLLPDPMALAFYRIYQQALNNIVRHAEASEVSVRLLIDPKQVCFEIQDNGKGLSKPLDWVGYARDGHLGIVGMKERAEAIGGTFHLISQPGEGTMIQVFVPIGEQK